MVVACLMVKMLTLLYPLTVHVVCKHEHKMFAMCTLKQYFSRQYTKYYVSRASC